jgi:hypothetical protein
MGQTQTHITSPNSFPNFKLVNFNVPKYLIKNFDELVRFKRVSRTSMLIHLMEGYIRSEWKQIKDDDDLNHMIKDLEHRNLNRMKDELIGLSNEVEEQSYPPMVPNVDQHHRDNWEDVSGTDRLWDIR